MVEQPPEKVELLFCECCGGYGTHASLLHAFTGCQAVRDWHLWCEAKRYERDGWPVRYAPHDLPEPDWREMAKQPEPVVPVVRLVYSRSTTSTNRNNPERER